jgi:predicted transcriptional regulator
MTQKELALKSRVDQSYICKLENNTTTKSPNLSTIFRIAGALETCPHALINNNYKCDTNCTDNCPQYENIFIPNKLLQE